jgi:hypothetical protein
VDLLDVVAGVIDNHPLAEVIWMALAWIPLLVLAHELGHAAGILYFTRSPVAIELGDRPFRLRFESGRCEFDVSPLTAFTFRGRCAWDPLRLKRRRDESWIALAGPGASLLTAAALLAGGMALGAIPPLEAVLVVGGVMAAGHALVTLAGDGCGALRIYRGGRGQERSYIV